MHGKLRENNFRLRWQRENGLMNKSKRRWFPKKPICEGGTRGFLTVGLQEVKPALELLAIGTGASLFIMIIEITVNLIQVWLHKRRFKVHFNGMHLLSKKLKVKY